jgi:hypothetical protein
MAANRSQYGDGFAQTGTLNDRLAAAFVIRDRTTVMRQSA